MLLRGNFHILKRQVRVDRINRNGLLTYLIRLFRNQVRITMYATRASGRRVNVIYATLRFCVECKSFNGLLNARITRRIVIFKVNKSNANVTIFLRATRSIRVTFLSKSNPVTSAYFKVTFMQDVIILRFKDRMKENSNKVIYRFKRLPNTKTVNGGTINRRCSQNRILRYGFTYRMNYIRATYK